MKKIYFAIFIVIGVGWLFGCNKDLGNLRSPLYGNEQGNGGDNRPPDDGAMWFTGKRGIKLCLDRNSAFPISSDEVKPTIQRVFDTWKMYFQERVLNGPGAIVFSNPSNAPSFDYSMMEQCDQSEDLKLYLGSSDEVVEKAKSGFANPTAFAHRTAYDVRTAWGKGFIWVAPSGPNFEWSTKPNLLLAMLLHEFGHVFGCEHVEGTIMTEKIVRLVQSGSVSMPSMAEPYLTRIDNNKELILNPATKLEIEGFGNADACKVLIGRPCQGSVRGKLFTGSPLKMVLNDDAGQFEIPLSLQADGVRFMNEARTFKIYRTGDSTVYYWIAGGGGSVDYGSASTTSGSTVDVMVERNTEASSAGRVRVRYRYDNKLQELFSAFRYIW